MCEGVGLCEGSLLWLVLNRGPEWKEDTA